MRRVHARTPPRMHRSPRRSPAAGRPIGPRPVVRWSSWDRLSSARRTTAALLPRPSIPRAKWHGPSRALSRRFRQPGGTVVDAVAGALSGSTELCSPPSTACSAAGTRSREGLAVRTHGRLRARRQHQEVPPRRGLDGRSARAGGCAADPPAGPPGRQDHVEVAVRGLRHLRRARVFHVTTRTDQRADAGTGAIVTSKTPMRLRIWSCSSGSRPTAPRAERSRTNAGR